MTSMIENHVRDEVKPIRAQVRPTDASAKVLAMLEREGLSFAVVVAPESDELLGVVLRGVLQNACTSIGHDPSTCTIRQHLKADVDVSLQNEPAREFLNDRGVERVASRLRTIRARSRERLPVIVLDEQRRPVGLRTRTQ
jgi:CBS domain-containing protein